MPGQDSWGRMRHRSFEIQVFERTSFFLKRGNVPDDQIRNGLEQIYNAKGNGYEEAVAMTGALYSLLSVFMHYHEGEDQERDAKLLYVEKGRKLYRNQLFLSRDGGRYCRLCRESAEVICSALFRPI